MDTFTCPVCTSVNTSVSSLTPTGRVCSGNVGCVKRKAEIEDTVTDFIDKNFPHWKYEKMDQSSASRVIMAKQEKIDVLEAEVARLKRVNQSMFQFVDNLMHIVEAERNGS